MPYHHFLMDWDNVLHMPHTSDDEYLLPSKTYGHFHVIRPMARLTLVEYLEELKKRKASNHYRLGVNLKEVGYLFVYNKIPDLSFMERFVRYKDWRVVIHDSLG